jgi:hypothetical protein
MKTRKPPFPFGFQRLILCPAVLAACLLSACSSERRDRLWQKLDPAGYKHAHSESFNGARAVPIPHSDHSSESGDIPLELSE